jgi:hypothetical protein
MALTRYKLVGHEKLKGLNYKGDNISFDKIDDTLADKLYGKTHVLVRLEEGEVATAEAAPAAEAAAEAEVPVKLELGTASAEAEAPTTRRTRANS